MVKILQCLKTSQICYLTHTEHHATNRTSLRGLDHDTLFLNDPLPMDFWPNFLLSGCAIVGFYCTHIYAYLLYILGHSLSRLICYDNVTPSIFYRDFEVTAGS